MNDEPNIDSESPWADTAEATARRLKTDSDSGLTSAEVRNRQARYGLNALQAPVTQSLWAILLNQVKSLIVALLAAAAVLSMLFGEWTEAWAIFAVLVVNTLIGFVTELKAVCFMEALRRLGTARVVVRRDGHPQVVEAESLVPGDIVLLDAGDSISADLRLTEVRRIPAPL